MKRVYNQLKATHHINRCAFYIEITTLTEFKQALKIAVDNQERSSRFIRF